MHRGYISSLLMLLGVSVARSMEIGAGGVWDSPMATDYWVKRFGFMWGGGSSGMSGLKALQTVSSQTETPEFDKSIYNPSGMYGMKVSGKLQKKTFLDHLKAMDPSAPEYQYPGQVRASTHNPQLFSGQKEKSMVELSPVVVPMPGENKQMSFNRFMAVP